VLGHRPVVGADDALTGYPFLIVGWSRKRFWLLGLGIALPAAAAAGYWFEPWKLLVNEDANDAAPGTEAGARVVGEGSFRSLEHPTTGRALLLQLESGERVLRLEDLATSNGPQLIVMLSSTPATEDGWSAYDDGPHLKLQPLKGNRGSQNYTVPGDVDLSIYRSAVVWCDRFDVGFGAAPIR
jgi:hypothetical protein